ncbi:hypothetical protein VAA_01608 [Vibrio anguillarum 775]|nr:hypothetical protein VAA_01608 [Vibrio anguillarum 775]
MWVVKTASQILNYLVNVMRQAQLIECVLNQKTAQ